MIVGITGGIGSGKTFVCNLFAQKGIPIYISDIEAKKIMNSNIEVKNAIIDLFGNNAYHENGLNRAFISSQVFSNTLLLEQLNKIVHPAVDNHFNNWYKEQNSKFVIKESAILFETGGYKKCNYTILVSAPEALRIKRVIKRDQTTEELVRQRIKNQWSDEKKGALATYVITNIEKEKTREQVDFLYFELLKKDPSSTN